MTVQQITKGIKISVKTKEEGFIQENELDYYTFSYEMSGFFTMENIRNKTSFKVTIPTFNLSTIASLN